MANLNFIVHDDPVGRKRENYIARVDLEPFGLEGEVEQIWLARAPGELFEVCCIPFRSYGIAFRDHVQLDDDGQYVVAVVRRQGHRVLRALFKYAVDDQRVPQSIVREIRECGLLYEWSGGRHVAIDVAPGVDPSRMVEIFDDAESSGVLFWEWGDADPFVYGNLPVGK